jgi:hypothetical protein
MRNKLLKLILPTLLASPSVMAQGQPNLTPEQLRHEQALTELRKQKEILELKHSQAQLLRECNEMGIDCRSQTLEIKQQPAEQAPEIESFNVPMQAPGLEESMFSLESISGSRNSNPTLEAIQNDSAKLHHAGNSQWALVGDKVGDWVVTHIDASKVRIKHSGNSQSKTLVLNW